MKKKKIFVAFPHILGTPSGLPHIWLCTQSHLNFLIYEENFVFFLSVHFHQSVDSGLGLGVGGREWDEFLLLFRTTKFIEQRNETTTPWLLFFIFFAANTVEWELKDNHGSWTLSCNRLRPLYCIASKANSLPVTYREKRLRKRVW